MGYCNNSHRLRQGLGVILAFALLSGIPLGPTGLIGRGQQRIPSSDGATIEPISRDREPSGQQRSPQELSSASAIATSFGVSLQWHTSFEQDVVGFNVYRVQDGRRVQVNHSIIPGSVFRVGDGKPVVGGAGYSWLDKGGTVDAVYYLESLSLDGIQRSFPSAINVTRGKPGERQAIEAASAALSRQPAAVLQGLRDYPSQSVPLAVLGQPGNQWFVAGQAGLKIQIDHEGWYRVTQQQASSAGFNPVVDIMNLSVFADGVEIAITTSKASGQFTNGDYLEFYGRGLDTPDTNIRVYYLVANSHPGKRGFVEEPPNAAAPPATSLPAASATFDFNYQGIFAPLVNLVSGASVTPARATETPSSVAPMPPPKLDSTSDGSGSVQHAEPVPAMSHAPGLGNQANEIDLKQSTAAVTAAVPSAAEVDSKPSRRSRRKRQSRRSRPAKRHYAHALSDTATLAASFDYTVKLKERYLNPGVFSPNYYTKAINGEEENWFGQVITGGQSPCFCLTQTLPLRKVNPTADGPAQLVVALQGVIGNFPTHQINVLVNDVAVGSVQFFGLDHVVKTFNVPVDKLVEGNNVVKFVRTSTNDISLIDYVAITYPHSYQAFNDSLRFTATPAQTVQLDGFSNANVRLLDISDPTAVEATQLVGTASGNGFAVTVPADTRRKGRRPRLSAPELQAPRTLYALLQGQFETPAGFSLNAPSSLNLASNHADLIILAYKDFVPLQSVATLVAKRSQLPDALEVKVVDIDDVYDEFSYGAHDHHAIRNFLLQANGTWTKKPRYLLLLGDASYDPRNYEGFTGGGGDLVPTNLVDTLFGEACSDDVLADFNDDGIAEIAVGRLPAATVGEADAMISKIVNFTKATVPQTALMVADDNTDPPYYFDFETASDQLGGLLQPSLTVQKIYRRIQGTCTARTNIINGVNQGVALVNYAGHGNLNVWAGNCSGSPFFQSPDARALTNGANHLPLVIVANCLNGQFNLPPIPNFESLAEAFVRNANGGGVAVYASSGETIPDGQQQMNVKLYQTLFGPQSMALGDVTKLAKTATTDMDVRHTWILLGDPSMKIW
jgi:hypothetical protein